MIKKLAALFMAGIFFLSSPSFAQAEEFYGTNVPTKPPEGVPQSIDEDTPPPSTADKPEENAHGLDSEYYDPPVYEEGQEPPQTVEPPPVDDGEGLEFLVYHQNGVMAFAIIADHEKYQLRPVLARGQIPGRATVSQMNAPDAIATINASYFAPNGIILGLSLIHI